MAARARCFWCWMAAAFILILLVGILPLLSVTLAYTVADANGCPLNEARVHPCSIFGFDAGPLLYFLSVLGWLAMASIPLAGLALILWCLIAIIYFFRTRRSS